MTANTVTVLIAYIVVLLVQQSHVSVESLNLRLEFMRVLDLLSIEELHMLDVSLKDLHFLLSCFQLASGLGINSDHVFASEILRLVDFAEVDLLLLVLLVLPFKVLDLLIQLPNFAL